MTPPQTRRWGLLGVLLVGTLAFVAVAHHHQPLGGWLFFHYLQATLLAAVFASACLVSGHALLLRVLGRTLPLEEHAAIAFALGVLAFSLVTFACGLLGLYGPAFFVGCPSLLLVVGLPSARRTLAAFRRHAAGIRWRLRPTQALVFALGCVGAVLVWLPILTPENASYDSRWHHLSIAQHYVAEGALRRFDEGWVFGAQPQLASLLYAWALCAPGALFDRVETAAHVELITFLFALVGVSALVRSVLGKRAPWAFAALFLFPGIYCYDSGLVLGADHVAAVWAAPILLLSLRYLDAADTRVACLLGGVLAGALSTKYTAVNLLPLPLLVVLVRGGRDVRGLRRPESLLPPLALATSVVVLTAPHWLKNWIFYGDPLFPILRGWLGAHPWSPAAEAPYETWFALRHPPFGWHGIGEMLTTLVTFPFVPHDFEGYHGKVPIFGSLFTLLTPALFFVRPRRRLLWLFAGCYLGLVAWFWLHQFDRYLQTLVPWMAAGTAASLSLLWREGALVRTACGALVTLQLVWGSDVPFIPAHRAGDGVVLKSVIDLASHHFRGPDPLESFPPWQAMGRALPPGAKVLIHEEEVHFGLSRATALDYSGDQGVFYWGEPGASTPAEIWRLLRQHGITHLVWASKLDHASDTVAAGLTFFDFATRYAKPLGTFGGFVLAALPPAEPPSAAPGQVAYYPCDRTPPFSPGVYDLHAMARAPGDRRPIAKPRADSSMAEAIATSRWLVFDARCHGRLPEAARNGFELLAARGNAMLLERKEAP